VLEASTTASAANPKVRFIKILLLLTFPWPSRPNLC
jgi:hypothetical protein